MLKKSTFQKQVVESRFQKLCMEGNKLLAKLKHKKKVEACTGSLEEYRDNISACRAKVVGKPRSTRNLM